MKRLHSFAANIQLIIAASFAVSLLQACASYTPKPLDDADVAAVLASPDRAVLVREAAARSKLDTPWGITKNIVTLDFSKPLSLDEVAVIAVLSNPDLRALRAQQRIAEAQVFDAGLLPDPKISFGIDRLMAPSHEGLANAYSVSLSLDLLAALATREVERRAAQNAAEQVRLDIAWQEWNTAGEARLLALRIPYQQRAAELAEQAAQSAEQQLARTLALVQSGDLNGDELTTRRLAAADACDRALAAQRDAQGSRLELNRMLGLRPDETLELAPATPAAEWTRPDPDALFEDARHARLDLQALAAGYESQQAALHRAVLGQYPQMIITLNRARDTSRVQTFGPAVTFDLPLWNRNRGAIAIADADRERLRDVYAERLHQTRGDIAALIAALDRDEAARAALAQQLGDAQRIATAYQAAAENGDLTKPKAEAITAAVIDKRLALLALEQSCAEQTLALALTVGHLPDDSSVDPSAALNCPE
jgi:outer membrane protein TolC